MSEQKNIFGDELNECSCATRTGYFRDGFCHTDNYDQGSHTVCCFITQEFLEFSRLAGNDLSTPRPEYDFPGLNPGDHWCVCASRWLQAEQKEKAPPVILESCHEKCLEIIPLETLKLYAYKDV